MGDSNFGQFLYYLTALVISYGFSWAVVAVAVTLTALHIGVQKLSERDPPIQPLGDRTRFIMQPGSPKAWFAGRVKKAPSIISATNGAVNSLFITTLADHPIAKINNVYFDSEPMLLPGNVFRNYATGKPYEIRAHATHSYGKAEADIMNENRAVEFNSTYLAAMQGGASGAAGGAAFTDPDDAAQCTAFDSENSWAARMPNPPFRSGGRASSERRAGQSWTATQLRTAKLPKGRNPSEESNVLLRDHLKALRDVRGIELGSCADSKTMGWNEQDTGGGKADVGSLAVPIWGDKGKIWDPAWVVSPARRQLHTAYHAQGDSAKHFGYTRGPGVAQGRPGENGVPKEGLSCGMYYCGTGEAGALEALLREMRLYSGDWRTAALSTKDGERLDEGGMLADGVSWMIFLLRRVTQQDINRGEHDPSIWYQGIPNIVVEMERTTKEMHIPDGVGGIKAGFKRKADGTPMVGDAEIGKYNSALALYDYMRRYTPYGRDLRIKNPGTQPDEVHEGIDAASVARAVQKCDSYISLKDSSGAVGGDSGTSGKTSPLEAHGAVNLNAPPDAVINQLAMAMNMGAVTEIAGKRYFHAGEEGTATKIIDDNDIVKDSWRYSPGGPASERPTTFRAFYLDEKFREEDVGVRREEDDFTFGSDLELQFVNNADQAEQIARIFMERALDAHQISFSLRNLSKLPDPNEPIFINLPDLGLLPSERWRVAEVRVASGIAEVSAYRENKSIFTWARADKFEYARPEIPQKRQEWDSGAPPDEGDGRNPGEYFLKAKDGSFIVQKGTRGRIKLRRT